MTTQQTDIEKTLKRILARELPTWRNNADSAVQDADGEVKFMRGVKASLSYSQNVWERRYPVPGCIYLDVADDRAESIVTRAEWEAERALLASEQAQPVGDAEAFDQALWDRVAVAAVNGEMSCQSNATKRLDAGDLVRYSFAVADAFMAERAKRIAARKASHD